MAQNYQLDKIRTLLTEGFSDEELRALCFDWPEFKPVYHALAHNSGKAEIVSRLLEYAERTRQLDHLLDLAKTHNPAKYTEYEPYTPDDSTAESPYRGLQYFDVSDADLFFGREQLTAKLVARLSSREAREPRSRGEPSPSKILAVVGASGSGKSSLVRAGLIPALNGGKRPVNEYLSPNGSDRWLWHIITPTEHPLKKLATTLISDPGEIKAANALVDALTTDPRSLDTVVYQILGRTPAKWLLLVVDQFEELFTLCQNEAERQAFVDNLLTAVDPKTAGPTLVVLTLRADFYASCAQYENLREALAHSQEYIGPMSGEELRRAIELPAHHAGYEFEPKLVELILRDVDDEPGALPLLSHALLETWWRREGRRLTLAGYDEAGGVREAITQTAESVFGRLTEEQQAIARRVFLRLTGLGEGVPYTRRRITLDQLNPQSEQWTAVEIVLHTLVQARLVMTDKDSVEVAHEVLIRKWLTLQNWLDEDREGWRLYHRLIDAAKDWEQMKRDPGMLYRGARLAQAREWANQNPGELNFLEQQFLIASSSSMLN